MEDHLGVVDGFGAVAQNERSRLAELLDREILPCLERPGRLLGPFDLPPLDPDRPSNVALIWPFAADGIDAPAALRPLFESVAPLRAHQPGLACVPATDLERELERRRLPLFSRPQWTPLDRQPLWIAVLPEPLHLLGLLTVLRSARVPTRAVEREGEPTVVLTGPGADRLGDVALVFGDAVIEQSTLDAAWWTRLGVAWSQADTPDEALREAGLGEGGRLGALGAPPVSSKPPAPETATESEDRPGRRDDTEPLLAHGTDQLRRPFRERLDGRGTSFVERLWLGSASARLRERHGMASGEVLAREIAEVLSTEAGVVALDLVWGLPGETAEDRAALAPLLDALVAAAPRGVRQLRVRLGWYVPTAAEREAGARPIGSADATASLRRLEEDLRARRLRVDTTAPARAAVASVLDTAPAVLAPVVETVHHSGARTAEALPACDPALWLAALSEAGLESLWPAPGEGEAGGTPSAHEVPVPEVRGSSPPPRRSRRSGGGGVARRADRWKRWEGLVSQQVDVRLAWSKRGRMRLLGPGEVTDLFLRACERARIPLASSGVVQPRPKISFGPSLPAGVAGANEAVDLGLRHKVEDLVTLLQRELPEGLDLRGQVTLPPHAQDLALSNVARAEYEARIESDAFTDPKARDESLRRLDDWRRRIEAGEPCVDDPEDVLRQLIGLQVHDSADADLVLRFVLDLGDPGRKCKPREVLQRAFSWSDVQVRRVSLSRLGLWAVEEQPGRVEFMTPFEQARRARRRRKARAKFCA